jgi:hypothetical protein
MVNDFELDEAGFTVTGSALNDKSRSLENDHDNQSDSFPRKTRAASVLDNRLKYNQDVPGQIVQVTSDMDGDDPAELQDQLNLARDMILKLEAEKLRIAEEHNHLSVVWQESNAVASSTSDVVAYRRDDLFSSV